MIMILLLVIIYISFISLGLPDSLLGSAWPSMYESLSVPISYAGIAAMIASCGTVVSSVFSAKVIKRFGTHTVTAVSVSMTAAALLGYSISANYAVLCIFAIPLGLGAGSIDTALNNFVATHLKAKHMSWLHCFWGVGATIGPIIMAFSLTNFGSWRLGYQIIGIIQVLLTVVLFTSRPLWKKYGSEDMADVPEGDDSGSIGFKYLLCIPGAKYALMSFFCYCAVESTAGLWGASYLVIMKAVSPETAARLISMYYFGITAGRFISGFLTMRLANRQMIKLGIAVSCCGVALMFLPFGTVIQAAAFLLTGIGLAPIFPSLIHDTPVNFGREHSQSMIGLQMASAYIGSTLMPPLFGMLAQRTGYGFFSVYLSLFLAVMVILDLSRKRCYNPVKK